MKLVFGHGVKPIDTHGFWVVIEVEEKTLASGFDRARLFDSKDAEDFSEVSVRDGAQTCG